MSVDSENYLDDYAEEMRKILDDVDETIKSTQKKRGRKSKKELLEIEKLKEESILNGTFVDVVPEEVKCKKRGRKPKGGKIIEQFAYVDNNDHVKNNVILFLKCSLKDIDKNDISNISNKYEGVSMTQTFDNSCADAVMSSLNGVDNNVEENNHDDPHDNNEESYQKCDCQKYISHLHIQSKLKELEMYLKNNLTNDNKSACFYCTESLFDCWPCFIPKFQIDGVYHVYGHFCSPSCAVGYLMNESIDSSIKFERYFLLNHIYCPIFNYTKNIKPSPNPYYTLQKYCGNLSIEEYRQLTDIDRIFLIIDKPITRSLPELHEDNDDCIINNKIIPSHYQIKRSIK
jgi:hypothetical protein